MPSLRRIVAATDFSAFSERVVQRAANLASQHQAELHLLHVVRPLELYPVLTLAPDEFTRSDEEVRQAEHSRLDTLAAALASASGIEVRTATRVGRAHGEIAAYAEETSADLVVAGARGENTLMDLFLGSTASRLLRVVACPVLVVRALADKPYGQVLAAIDFSPLSAAVVEHALVLAGGAPVKTLHVLGSEVEQRLRRAKSDHMDFSGWLERQRVEAEKRLDALLAQIQHTSTVTRVVLPGFPPAAICQFIDENHADLVVLGRHGHGGLQHWLLGSVSQDVALAAACDVLIIGPGRQ